MTKPTIKWVTYLGQGYSFRMATAKMHQRNKGSEGDQSKMVPVNLEMGEGVLLLM